MLRAAATYPFVNLTRSPWKNSNTTKFASFGDPFSTNNYPASCNYLFHNEVNYRQKNESKIAACQSRMCHFSVDFYFFTTSCVGLRFWRNFFLVKFHGVRSMYVKRNIEMIIWVFMTNLYGGGNLRRSHMRTQTRFY